MMNLKKVLIISYFFPPSAFTGSHRIYSWAKYLHLFGIYPTIVTRSWKHNITDYKDISRPDTGPVRHEKHENYEVYYLPYKPNLRDRIYYKNGETKFRFIRKVLSLFELFFQNFTTRVLPYRNLYTFSRSWLQQNPDTRVMITSGKPFTLFSFCHRLSKQTGIPWIADYRDDWNTTQFGEYFGFVDRLLNRLEVRTEKKWLHSVAAITSISDNYSTRIAEYLKKPGYTIMNGYDEDEVMVSGEATPFDKLTILFSGSLYPSQPVEIFTEAYKKLIDHYERKIKICLMFLGLNFEAVQAARVRKLLEGYEAFYEITDRVEHKEAIDIQMRSHAFLMFSHPGKKGVTSSKIFVYMACQKPIILCPSDNDILEALVKGTNSGYITNTEDETFELLNKLVTAFKRDNKLPFNGSPEDIQKYSRKYQAGRLAAIINEMVKTA